MKRISIQGIKGSFHHEAALKYFNTNDIEIVDCSTFKSLAENISSQNSDYGLMAIENSIAGTILPNYSLIIKNHLTILGEIVLPIRHNLLALPEDDLESITEVRTHPMALLQCENFLDKHPQWTLLSKDDTATCARNIHQKQMKGIAGIGSVLAAKMFHLKILAKDIHDVSDNFTRFYILSNKKEIIENPNKASLYFTLNHSCGSLSNVLDIFSDLNLNLTKIQSIPLNGTVFEYSFLTDLEFEEKAIFDNAIQKITPLTNYLHILGTYKKYIY